MPPTYMTMKDVSAHLGLTVRAVRRIISLGELSHVAEEGSTHLYDPVAVEQLRQVRASGEDPTPVRERVRRLERMVRELQDRVDTLDRNTAVCTAEMPPLTVEMAAELYQRVLEDNARTDLDSEEVGLWLSALEGLTHQDIGTLRTAVPAARRPWAAILRFLVAMHTWYPSHRARIQVCSRRLQATVMAYVSQMQGEGLDDSEEARVLEAASPVRALLASRRVSKSTRPGRAGR